MKRANNGAKKLAVKRAAVTRIVDATVRRKVVAAIGKASGMRPDMTALGFMARETYHVADGLMDRLGHAVMHFEQSRGWDAFPDVGRAELRRLARRADSGLKALRTFLNEVEDAAHRRAVFLPNPSDDEDE